MTEPLTPQIGDVVPLGIFLANIHAFGTVSDLDTPDQVSWSIEGFGSNGALNVAALRGDQGVPGTNAPLPKLQEPIYDSSDDLPGNLTDDDVDIGKYWIVREFDDDANQIGSWFYLWYGTNFQQFRMGSPGEAGPVPIITPSVLLLDPDDDSLTSNVVVTGDAFHPSWRLNLKAPRGPEGPATNIADAPDVDMTPPPETGDTLVYNAADSKWHPSTTQAFIPKFYTMPEASFVDVSLAINTRVQLGTFLVPPQEYDCVPVVFGHMRITGIELDQDPLIVGAEIRLGSPTGGTLVGRGYGNISSYTHIMPHASGSDSGTAADAISPDNGRGVIAAGATGAAATLYISAFNDGLAGIYTFSKRGAQISVQLLPV